MRSKLKKILLITFIGVLFFNFASAAIVECGGSGQTGGQPQTQCTLRDLIYTVNHIINFLLSWAWIVSIFFVLWGAWEMINSGGNEEALTKGKDTFKHAIIGFFLIMASYLLVNLIAGILTGTGTPGSGAFDSIYKFIYTP